MTLKTEYKVGVGLCVLVALAIFAGSRVGAVPYTVIYGTDEIRSVTELSNGLVCVTSKAGAISCACPCTASCAVVNVQKAVAVVDPPDDPPSDPPTVEPQPTEKPAPKPSPKPTDPDDPPTVEPTDSPSTPEPECDGGNPGNSKCNGNSGEDPNGKGKGPVPPGEKGNSDNPNKGNGNDNNSNKNK